MSQSVRAIVLALGAAGAAGCSDRAAADRTLAPDAGLLSRDALLDPRTCAGCHPNHFSDWAASMHAYASADPVFVAMNARGQRETDGGLGTFCVACHAPMAVRENLTHDGLNLEALADKYRGVTCFFCHQVTTVTDDHNGAVGLADDLAMRGEYADPIRSAAHAAMYSPLHDPTQASGAAACGACHDVVVPQTDAGIERTYFEWVHSAFNGANGATCIGCHMAPSARPQPIADVPNAPPRTVHDHVFGAVDVNLDPNADAGAGRAAVEQALGSALQGALCVSQGGGSIRVVLDPVAVGHAWPSGAAQDRRAWVEIVASRAGAIVYESGVVADGQSVTAASGDPDRWLLRDCMFDGQGAPVNMFWLGASSEGNELPALATFDPLDRRYYATHLVQRFPRDGSALATTPDRVTMRVRLQPVGLDVLADLVASGDLDAGVIAAMPTFDVPLTGPGGPALAWTAAAAATLTATGQDGLPETCVATPGFNVNAQRTLATNHTRCRP